MKKREVVERHQDANILSEKSLLFLCSSCPFILKLYQTFQSPGTLYMLMEFVQGGELWSYIYDDKKKHVLPRGPHRGFTDETVRFYAANVVLAFQHMHSHSIAYRDLKPENLLIDGRGYIKVGAPPFLVFSLLLSAYQHTYLFESAYPLTYLHPSTYTQITFFLHTPYLHIPIPPSAHPYSPIYTHSPPLGHRLRLRQDHPLRA